MPYDEVTYLGAGINHQSWILRFERDGEDLYPLLDAALDRDPELLRRVRVEIYRRFGRFPTESSEHSAEYLPFFLRSDEMIERFRVPVDEYVHRSEENLEMYEQMRAQLAAGEPFQIERSLEYASLIIHSQVTGEPRTIYGNVRNDGLIPNLPHGCCVEVPCLADRAGVQPTAVGALPPQLAALNRTFANVCELTVRAALDGSRRARLSRRAARPQRGRHALTRGHLRHGRRPDRRARRRHRRADQGRQPPQRVTRLTGVRRRLLTDPPIEAHCQRGVFHTYQMGEAP